MFKIALRISIAILIIFSLFQCNTKPNEAAPTAPNVPINISSLSYLVDTQFVGKYSTSQVLGLLPQGASLFYGGKAKYPVTVFSITYRTKNYDNSLVTASGIVIVPEGIQNISQVSYQHGTILKSDEKTAPSYFSPNSEGSAISLMGSNGFLTCAPDYIGYGASKHLMHPYEHAASTASTCVDMILASRELAKVLFKQMNGKVYLMGYSQGGTATIATQKLIEEKYGADLKLAAVCAGAGAYDKTAFAKYIVSENKELSFLNYYVWVLQTYNQIYNLSRPDSFYYNQPYANSLSKDAFATVSLNPQQLFTANFISGIKDGTDTKLMDVFAQNDLINWKPLSPTLLVHGDKDDFVPYFNSKNAYDSFVKNGSTSVSIRTINAGDHTSSYLNYSLETFNFFDKY